MKTDELVSLLTLDARPVPRHATARRLGLALALSLPVSVLVMLIAYGPRRDLMQALFWPMFWVKLIFPIVIAAAALVLVQRLARPGVPSGLGWLALGAPVVLVWALAAMAWVGAAAAERPTMLWGVSWRTCVPSIALIGAPVFVATFAAIKGLAPTRPVLAGAAAGALAGGAGAAVYAVHCIELAAPFLAVWYVMGIAVPMALGAALGPRLLRW